MLRSSKSLKRLQNVNVRKEAQVFKFLKNLFKEAGVQLEQTSPLTMLPDGSAYFTASFPLPKDHWLLHERTYNPGEDETADFPRQFVLMPRVLYEEHVTAAAKWAVRASTDCGKEMDFDPDAMVLNIVYALCGPCKSTLQESL